MKQLSRKILVGLALAGAVGIAGVEHAAEAKAPLAKAAQPGWYRMMLGDFEITALSDGTGPLPVDTLLTNTTPAKVTAALAKAYLKSPVETSFNGYLINTGAKLVLIDTGAGTLFLPTLNHLVANLKASGYQPEQVDEIYITHMHPDHVGGLVAKGKLVFPNATVRAAKAEGEFWLPQAALDKAPAEFKGFFQGAQSMVNPYVKAGKYKPIDADGELVPGIKAVSAVGHTAGHMIYEVESKGQKLVVWGDLMHVAAVQFPEPAVTIQFDTDAGKAAEARKKAYADAAKAGYFVAVSHVSFPGLGQIRTEGAGYEWLPVNYTTATGPAPATPPAPAPAPKK
jgi:glyoxylase-like metal-dependent hydrolase (beta-lactamase superfamily II)